jgi:hypothetical protein
MKKSVLLLSVLLSAACWPDVPVPDPSKKTAASCPSQPASILSMIRRKTRRRQGGRHESDSVRRGTARLGTVFQ